MDMNCTYYSAITIITMSLHFLLPETVVTIILIARNFRHNLKRVLTGV